MTSTNDFPQQIQQLIQSFDNTTLVYCALETDYLVVRLEFFAHPNTHYIVQFAKIAHLSLSKWSDEKLDGGFIGEIWMKQLQPGETAVFTSFRYPFKGDPEEQGPYPETIMYHFHMDGSVYLDIICEVYNIYTDVPRN